MRRTRVKNSQRMKEADAMQGCKSERREDMDELKHTGSLLTFSFLLKKKKKQKCQKSQKPHICVELPMLTMIKNQLHEWCRPVPHGPASSASPGRLAGMQNPRSHPRPTESERTRTPGGSYIQSSLRRADVDSWNPQITSLSHSNQQCGSQSIGPSSYTTLNNSLDIPRSQSLHLVNEKGQSKCTLKCHKALIFLI